MHAARHPLKMRYSYEHGLKAFLERIASWEEGNREREARRQEKLLAAIRADSLAKAQKSAGRGKTPDAVQLSVAQTTGEVQGAIGATLQGWGFQLEQTFGKLRSDHPDITERIDAPARAVEATRQLSVMLIRLWRRCWPRARTSARPQS